MKTHEIESVFSLSKKSNTICENGGLKFTSFELNFLRVICNDKSNNHKRKYFIHVSFFYENFSNNLSLTLTHR